MKIVAQESARITVLFPLEEVVPLSGFNGLEAINKIQQRYEFLKVPDPGVSREEIAKTGYKFGTGQIQLNGTKGVIVQLGIFSDGISADAQDSEIAEKFLIDIIRYLQSDFSFRPFATEPRWFFHNQMVVEFKNSPAGLIASFGKISDAISKYLDRNYKTHVPMSFFRLDLQVDKNIVPEPAPKFILERRVGIAFEKERYYSSAPLRTVDHIALLEEIEKLAG